MNNHNPDTIIITRVISAWGWHIIAIMFFLKTISFFVVREPYYMLAMLLVFMFCEYIAFKRRQEVI